MFYKTDGIKYMPKRRSKSKRRNNKNKSRRRSKSTRRRRSKLSKRRILKKSHKKDGMNSTKFNFFKKDMYDGTTLYAFIEGIYTYLYIYIPKGYLKNENLEHMGGMDFVKAASVFADINLVQSYNNRLNFDINNGYYFYIKINNDIIDEDQIKQYMNDLYFKFVKYIVPVRVLLEKELLILEKEKAEVKKKEFKELLDEKNLEYLDYEIKLITDKMQKIENEKDKVLLIFRLRSEEMLFVIYKTIDDLREYFIKNNEWENLNELNEYINLIRENERLGLEDPVNEYYFLYSFYRRKFPKLFKERLREIYDKKPEEFRDKDIYGITIGNYQHVNAWRPLNLPTAYEVLFT